MTNETCEYCGQNTWKDEFTMCCDAQFFKRDNTFKAQNKCPACGASSKESELCQKCKDDFYAEEAMYEMAMAEVR